VKRRSRLPIAFARKDEIASPDFVGIAMTVAFLSSALIFSSSHSRLLLLELRDTIHHFLGVISGPSTFSFLISPVSCPAFFSCLMIPAISRGWHWAFLGSRCSFFIPQSVP
jgi:hypothetical protein